MIIAVERSTAQSLHVNPQGETGSRQAMDAQTWSVKTAGEFIIIMNNRFDLPIVVRHPQRFNDSRAFVAAFKREFLGLLALIPVPHAKLGLIRDDQFGQVSFTTLIDDTAARHLAVYQKLITSHNTDAIDWENNPSNAEIAAQLARGAWASPSDSQLPPVRAFEDYVMQHYHLPAHPMLNEHNRTYTYRSASLNDIMNAVAVNEHFTNDYQRYLEQRNEEDQLVDRDTNVAADYSSYCEANGISPLADLTLPYHYLFHYEDNNDGEEVSDSKIKQVAAGLRDLARFTRRQDLFTSADYAQFCQAIAQALNDRQTWLHNYPFRHLVSNLQLRLNRQRQSMWVSRNYADRQFKVRVRLAGYSPVMWREFVVSADTRLDKFCLQALASFHAQGHHLFNLQAGKTTYELPMLDSGVGKFNDLAGHWLGEYQAGDRFVLNYDLGDSWQFEILLEEERQQNRWQNNSKAQLLDGFGKGIIEDIGGPVGLIRAAKDDPTINQPISVNAYQDEWGRQIVNLARHYQ